MGGEEGILMPQNHIMENNKNYEQFKKIKGEWTLLISMTF